mgnify:CR=1 FL=1
MTGDSTVDTDFTEGLAGWAMGNPPRTQQHDEIMCHRCGFSQIAGLVSQRSIAQPLGETQPYAEVRVSSTHTITNALAKPQSMLLDFRRHVVERSQHRVRRRIIQRLLRHACDSEAPHPSGLSR